MSERPSVTMATRAITAETDVALRLKACRSLGRECARRVALVGVGCEVEGIEELELADRIEGAIHDYLTSRADPTKRRAYVGNTRGMDEIVSMLKERFPATGSASDDSERSAA